ncbi:MAG: hypothetical protein B6245_21025 [Desulfobacteraceae bacterium 4572_88]|nr:MAG: hypothetical protein B6245_21025 [Desulfobacteraceae bacterium 4572_88]
MKNSRKKKWVSEFLDTSSLLRGGLLIFVMSIFTVILYPNIVIPRHSYQLGDVAEEDTKAPRDFYIEDEVSTARVRQEAEEKVRTVYDSDAGLLPRLIRQTEEAFSDARKVFEAPEKEKKPDKPAEGDNRGGNEAPPSDNSPEETGQSPHDRIWQMKEAFEKKLGIPVDEETYKILEKEKFSKVVSDTVVLIISDILKNGVVANKEVLLRESEKGIALRELGTKTESIVHALKQYHGPEQYKEVVRIVAKPLVRDIGKSVIPIVVDFATRLIQPNITLNKSETEERKKKAANAVAPIHYIVKAGQMILREGDIVTDSQMRKLLTMNTEEGKEEIYARSVGAIMLLLCLLLIVYTLHTYRQTRAEFRHNKDLLFLSATLITFFFMPKISLELFDSLRYSSPFPLSELSLSFGIPLASGAMTVCLFLGLDIAVSFAMVVAICTAVIFQNRFELFVYFLLNGIMGAYWMKDCRERKVFIKAGAKLGCLNVVLATAVDVYIGNHSGMEIFWDWAFAFMGGLATGIITAGMAPLLEIAFGYTTHITLHEFANLEQPLLRRLMLEAPGTYHHSVVVGSMVEAAASEIGANPLLAKVCGYYHDIGKLKQPLYFIENQRGNTNRHDKLAPSMSALILIAHVKNGVEMGRKHKLGEAIIDSIQQHHGSSSIRFFYDKAKKLKGEDAVKIEDYRYPGPRPQTREAGLVMLADVVEAASRTLENPTPSRIQGHVQKLINSIFTDGQLDNCELTLRDLHNIARSFNKILNGIHHHRIEYPDAGKEKKVKKEREKVKKERDDPDKQQTKQPRNSGGKNKESGEGNLKRLGVP